jgi:2C-methyl-D-erythritol 2,4-cyclodiphosphate synthase
MSVVIASDSDVAPILTAKTCGSACKNGKVVYSFTDNDNQILFVDKKDVIKNQLEACQRLLPYISEIDRLLVEKEILELKTVLDLMQ